MFDFPVAALPFLDALISFWSHSVAPVLDDWFTRGQVIPDSLLALRRWQHILAPAAGLGAALGFFAPVDPHFNRQHPFVQRLSNSLGFAAFGLLCGFAVVFVMVMIAPILTK